MYSCWWTLTKNYRVKHFMVSILRQYTELYTEVLTHSLFTLSRCQMYSSSGTSKRCNSFCPWWSRHPIVSKRAPLARLQCVQFGLCVISERLLYWRSSSVSYCLWRAESMVLCWQDWWGNSYQDCGGNTCMALSLVIFLTYCEAWNVCGSLQFLCFAGTNFAIRRGCFFLLGIDFCDYRKSQTSHC